MPDTVSVTFTGNPAPLFQTADAVELRLATLKKDIAATVSALNFPTRTTNNLLSAETNALKNFQTNRIKSEEAYTAAYLTGIKVRQEAEIASAVVVAEARTASRVATSGSTAVSGAGAAAAGIGGAGFAGGLIAGASVAAVAGVGIVLSKSVTASEEARKKLFDLKTGTEDLDKKIDDLGKTGDNALVRYAASLNRTTESLTATEKRAVLVTTALDVQARTLGNATSKVSDYEKATAQMDKTSKSLLITLGGFVTPAATNALSFLNELLGGAPAESNAAKNDNEFNAWKTQQKAILDTFKKNQAELENAIKNPNSNLLNFSLTRFANSADLLSDPATAEKARNNALEMGKQWSESYVKGIRSQIKLSDIPELKNLSSQVKATGNLLPFDDYKNLLDEINKAIADSVDAGKKKVKELNVAYKSAFVDVFAAANSDNPFVKIYSEGEKALKSFREQTVGLSADLRQQGEAMIATQTALSVFKQRVETGFTAFDLREQADRFRNVADSPDAVRRRVDAGFDHATRRGSYFGQNDVDTSRFTDRQRAEIAGRQAYADILNDPRVLGNRAGIAAAAYRRYNPTGDDANLSTQERLDKQLKLASGLGANSEAQRAVIDNKVLSLAQNLNPADLRQDQRNNLAAIFERQAERTERRAQEAIDIQKKTLEVNQSIDANQKRLLGIAEKQGVQGIDRILVENGTDSQISVKEATRSPSPSDTSRYSNGRPNGQKDELQKVSKFNEPR